MRLIDADKIDFGKVFIGASDFAKDTREANAIRGFLCRHK